MSTYNGEKYLSEQIESSLHQEDVEVQLLVRDDGSTDQTINILNAYHKQDKLTFYQGGNLGPAKSFLHLLKKAPQTDYYAFSDQDDYWLPKKLSAAVNKIKSYKGPALYYCQTQLTDESLTPIESVIIHPKGTFGEALVYQFIGGCTMVMNSALRDIVNKYEPDYLPMHDIWVFNIALAIGADIIFDPNSYIYYRQHNANAIGQGYSRWEEWKRRIRRVLFNHEHLRSRVAKELKKGYYSDMPNNNKETLDLFINAKENFFKRMSLLRDKRFLTANSMTNRLFKLNVLLNTY